jgi:hypothetical protein
MIIASVVVCGVLGAGIGFPAAFIGFDLGVYDNFDIANPMAGLWVFVSMSVFGILGAVIGGFIGYGISRSIK